MGINKVAELTNLCKAVLTQLNRDTTSGEVQAWLEAQSTELNLWAKTLGVYAEGTYSIEYRLADNERLTGVITQLLSALCGNLVVYYRTSTKKAPPPSWSLKSADTVDGEDGDTDREDDDQEGRASDTSSDSSSTILEDSKDRVQSGLARLSRLAIRLRQEGVRRAAIAAQNFDPVDPDNPTVKLKPAFEEYAKTTLARAFDPPERLLQLGGAESTAKPSWPEPEPDKPLEGAEGKPPPTTRVEPRYEIEQYLRDRLSVTMLQRWRRLCYNTHHAANLAGPSSKTPANADTQKDKPKPIIPDPKLPIRPVLTPKPQQKPAVQKRATSAATKVAPELRIDPKADLKHSPSKTITTKFRAGDLNFPIPPVAAKGATLFDCPFCGRPQPSELLRKSQWQVHVMHDLEPYFCLFVDCDEAIKTYPTSDDWMEHIRTKHSRSIWICNECKIDSQFETADAYETHLHTTHGDQDLSEGNVSMMVRYAVKSKDPVYECCCFCGYVPDDHKSKPRSPESQQLILEHMSKHHLQFFALNCLPWDLGGVDGKTADRSAFTSGSGSEEAKREIMDQGSLHFSQDEASHDGAAQDQAPRPSTATLFASFAEIRKRWDITPLLSEFVETWLAKVEDGLGSEEEEDTPQDSQQRRSSQADLLGNDAQDSVKDVARSTSDASEESDDEKIPTKLSEAVFHDQLFDIIETGDPATLQAFLRDNEDNVLRFDPYSSGTQKLPFEGFPMHLAVAVGSLECIAILLRTFQVGDLDLNIANIGYPLGHAVRLQRMEILDELIKAGFRYWRPAYSHALPVLVAAAVGSLDMYKRIRDLGGGSEVLRSGWFDVRAFQRGPQGRADKKYGLDLPLPTEGLKFNEDHPPEQIDGSSLAVATLYGHEELARYVIAQGADVDEDITIYRDMSGAKDYTDYPSTEKTAILIACAIQNRSKMVELLLDAGAQIDKVDADGDDALAGAAATNAMDCVHLLLDRLKGKDIEKRCINGAFVHCCVWNNLEGVKFMLTQSPDLNAADRKGRHALLKACDFGSCELIDLLLASGCDINISNQSLDTPVSIACSNGRADILGLLIERSVALDGRFYQDRTLLMLSCFVPSTECLKLLLSHDLDTSLPDQAGDTVLHYAALWNMPEHIQVLVEHGALLEAPGQHGRTALIAAAETGRLEAVSALLSQGAEVNATSKPDETPALVFAALLGDAKMLELLLEHDAELEKSSSVGFTALIAACDQGNDQSVRLLLTKGANLEAEDALGQTATFHAVVNGHAQILQLCIEHGAKLDVEDAAGETMMFAAVKAGNIQCLQILMDAGASPKANEEIWEPALFLAAEQGSATCMSIALSKVSADCRNTEGETPLMVAVKNVQLECAKILLQKGASVNVLDKANMPLLHLAASSLDKDCLQLVIDHGANLEAHDGIGQTVLLHSIGCQMYDEHERRLQCLQCIVDAGASLSATDLEGQTALIVTMRRGCWDEAKILIAKGVPLDAVDNAGKTALMIAAQKELRASCESMLEAGASHSIATKDGMTALAYALDYHSDDSATELLKFGAELDVSKFDGIMTRRLENKVIHMLRMHETDKQAVTALAQALTQIYMRLETLRQAGDLSAILGRRNLQRLQHWLFYARSVCEDKKPRRRVAFVEEDGKGTPSDTSSVRDDEDVSAIKAATSTDGEMESAVPQVQADTDAGANDHNDADDGVGTADKNAGTIVPSP